MEETTGLSKQQKSPWKQRQRFSRRQSGFCSAVDMRHYQLKIYVKRPVCPTAAFITISKQRMIFCLIISKISRASIRSSGSAGNAEDAKRTIIQVYLNYVSYCKELGVEFMAGYYDTKNQALNPVSRTERPYPIVTVQNYVEKAIKEGRIQMNVEIEAFTTDIRMIVIGNVFEWCLRNGEADFEGNMARSLGKYLDSTLD